jgi:fermentation-respiration switch protein FrsA (DUF1100 family)
MAHYMFPYFPVTGLVHNQFDSSSKIAKCKSPIFQIHRAGDPVVPYEQGKRLFSAATARRYFVKLEGQDHDEALPDGMYERFRSFLKEAESPAGAALSVSGVPD